MCCECESRVASPHTIIACEAFLLCLRSILLASHTGRDEARCDSSFVEALKSLGVLCDNSLRIILPLTRVPRPSSADEPKHLATNVDHAQLHKADTRLSPRLSRRWERNIDGFSEYRFAACGVPIFRLQPASNPLTTHLDVHHRQLSPRSMGNRQLAHDSSCSYCAEACR